MKIFDAKPYLIKGKIQNYAWGTKNEDAFITQFLNIPSEKDLPYAELWMGAHPKAPAEITITGHDEALDALIKKHPEEILGKTVSGKFQKLPFLFKILSAAQALSIQAHPNKQQAIALHKKDPQHYPDDNHKPEIAIALSDLTALVGFKTFKQLVSTLENYPEIKVFIGTDIYAEMKKAEFLAEEKQRPLVKRMYRSLMTQSLSNKDGLLNAIENLDTHLREKDTLNIAEEKFLELRQIYPGPDSGLFSLFLLNLIQINPGEAIYLKAGLAHAYLKGNIIECMANSDNVVRAGLTPKFQDVDTLLEIINYETAPVEIQQGLLRNGELIYDTPVPEFQVSRIDLNQKALKQTAPRVQILLITKGQISISWRNNKEVFHKGQSVLIPACLASYTIGSPGSAVIFKATVPQTI